MSSGSLTQYPVRKERSLRTIRNIMRDGRMLSLPDSGASTLNWTLQYVGLSFADAAAVKALFDACSGPLQPFTFLDPTENLLAWSSDLTNSRWERPAEINIQANAADPAGGLGAFIVTNNGQSSERFFQSMEIPAGYRYCFSLYVKCLGVSTLTFSHGATSGKQVTTMPVGASWARLTDNFQLNDGAATFKTGISLTPGQSIIVYGPQLEAQFAASSYRPTKGNRGIYPECFWVSEELTITADGPNSYSALLSLETRI